MRAFVLGVLFWGGLISNAAAQIVTGPVAIKSDVNGVPITVRATSWVTIKAVDDKLTVDARIMADLVGLQKNFARIVGTFEPPAKRCSNRRGTTKNPVVTFKRGSLWPRGDQVVIFMRGHIDVWSCSAGRKKSAIRWHKKKIAFIRMSIPQIHTWRNVTKKKDGTQPFHGRMPVYLEETKDARLALQPANPVISLDGPEALLTHATLRLAKARISRTAADALEHAIDPVKLKSALPAALQKLDMTVMSARLRGLGGHVIAEINLGASLSGASRTQLLQTIASRSSN